MSSILYKNAIYFKNEILPYVFILESKNYAIIIKASEHDFAHLVGKQHSKNLSISQLNTKEFFQKVLEKELTYSDLIDFDEVRFHKEYQWIQTKNNLFADIFSSFINKTHLKLYKKISCEAYTSLDMDYYHESKEEFSILGIIGDMKANIFSFNSIMGNDDKLETRLKRNKPIFILKTHKIKRGEEKECIKNLNVKVIQSPRNKNNKHLKIKSNKTDLKKIIKEIIKILGPGYELKLGVNGKNTIQIKKNGTILEQRYKPLQELQTAEDIAKDILSKY